MHEVEHARNKAKVDAAFKSGSKETYLEASYDDETSSVMKEIELNDQLRAAGQEVPVDGTEAYYRPAYDKGRADHLAGLDEYQESYNAARDAELAKVPPGETPSEVTKSYADFVGKEAAEARLKELHPQGSKVWQEADEAGRTAGRTEIRKCFKDGTFQPSGEHGHTTYGDLYGEHYDDTFGTNP